MVGVDEDEVSFAGDVDEVAGDDEVLVGGNNVGAKDGGDNVGAKDIYVGVNDTKSLPPVTTMSWPVTTMSWPVTTSQTTTCG